MSEISTMSWSKPKIVELSENVAPSYLCNNLAADGRGRFAFAHGGRVQCTKKHDKKQGRSDFSLAMKYVISLPLPISLSVMQPPTQLIRIFLT